MENKSANFKKCSCGHEWQTRQDFLSDPEIQIQGYIVYFKELTLGLYIFMHKVEGCLTSIAMKAGVFSDLYKGKIFKERLTGKDDCPGYCLLKPELSACPQKCECAWVREVIQIINNWPKQKGAVT